MLSVSAFIVMSGCRYRVSPNLTHLLQPPEQSRPLQTVSPNLAKAEVVAIAQHLAEQKGERAEDYQPPIIHFDSTTGEWHLWFHLKPPGHPGGHFGVVVNDKTKTTEFIPGE